MSSLREDYTDYVPASNVGGVRSVRFLKIIDKYDAALLPYLTIAEDDEFLAGKFFQTHGPACVNACRADTHFCA